MVNNDAVVRTNYYKYFHPKECLIQNGVLNRAVSEAAGKTVPGLSLDEGVDAQVEKYNIITGLGVDIELQFSENYFGIG